MAISKLLLVVASLLLAATSATASTVHEELSKYGLPPGLLPDSVISCSLGGNGDFVVELSSPCYVKFTDLVYYEDKIKGKLSYGVISDLEGIQVKKLFAWFPLARISALLDGKELEFQVGFLSEKLPVSLFANIPHCKAAKGSYHGLDGLVAEDAVVAVSEVGLSNCQKSSLFVNNSCSARSLTKRTEHEQTFQAQYINELNMNNHLFDCV